MLPRRIKTWKPECNISIIHHLDIRLRPHPKVTSAHSTPCTRFYYGLPLKIVVLTFWSVPSLAENFSSERFIYCPVCFAACLSFSHSPANGMADNRPNNSESLNQLRRGKKVWSWAINHCVDSRGYLPARKAPHFASNGSWTNHWTAHNNPNPRLSLSGAFY